MVDEEMGEPPVPNTPTEPQPEIQQDYKKVLAKVQAREQVLKDKWLKEGRDVWEIYLGDKDNIPFNILYSNTETIAPAVFSRIPVAKVLRRYDEERADIPAKAAKRMLDFVMDTNLASYPSFKTAVEDCVMDAALPGLGQARVRVVKEIPCVDYVPYDRFIWGYCERWEDCQWIAFRYDKTVEDTIKEFQLNEVQAKALKDKATDGGTEKNEVTGEEKPSTICIYEYWDKVNRVVHYLCDCVDNCCLVTDNDPLKLENFFPVPPKPLSFVRSTTDTLPRPLYNLYRSQAEELNEVTRRIKLITKAIRVRGVYAGNLPEIAKVFEEGDNTLIPGEAASQILSMQKGLDAYIWMVPIDLLIKVLRELYNVRDQIKSTIYEILGLGDILRGVSKASETLGAQEIKDKWGSLRINNVRERTTEFIRDLLRLVVEVAAKNCPPQSWEQITGLNLLLPIESLVMHLSGGGAGAPPQMPPMASQPGAQPQLPGMPPEGPPQGMPPPGGMPPQGPPQAPPQGPPPGMPPPGGPAPSQPLPDWKTVIGVLQNDLKRAYTIDIETDSSVDPEATDEKKDTAEFMNALGQAMNGLKPLMEGSVEGWQLGKAILTGICNKFDLGEEVEPLLRKLQPPKSLSGPPPEIQQLQQQLDQREKAVQKQEEDMRQQSQTFSDMMANSTQALAKQKQQIDQIASDRQEMVREKQLAEQEMELEKQNILLLRKENQVLAQEQINKINQAKNPPKPAAPRN